MTQLEIIQSQLGNLYSWFRENKRAMPWRDSRNVYRVWVSEIMLQQTRVDQVRPYFDRFIAEFPTVEKLAKAEVDDVLKCWEGLGYYARARNLHAAARVVMDRHGGEIPNEPTAFNSLPGVGAYTVAAVLSICCDEPMAAVDANVQRVVSRLMRIQDDLRKSSTKTRIRAVADVLVPRSNPGEHNEALMELGATICTPRDPSCNACPFDKCCLASVHGEAASLPYKSRKKPIPHIQVAVGILTRDNKILVQQRPHDGMLGGLWEFPGGKRRPDESLPEACGRELKEELGIEVEVGRQVARVKHAYSHFSVDLHAFVCEPPADFDLRTDQPTRWVTPNEMESLAFPRANRKILEVLAEEL